MDTKYSSSSSIDLSTTDCKQKKKRQRDYSDPMSVTQPIPRIMKILYLYLFNNN